MSPVRPESRQLLESPRRKLRSVCKTPYRVLDAPELADDFYLNLVDWSSTNVLGVGLGSAVYLWAAHTAAVSKLCDLASTNDTISSVAWAQKVSQLTFGITSRFLIHAPHTPGFYPRSWHTIRSPPHLRCTYAPTFTDLQPGSQSTRWCNFVESVCSELGFSGPNDLSSGYTRKGY